MNIYTKNNIKQQSYLPQLIFFFFKCIQCLNKYGNLIKETCIWDVFFHCLICTGGADHVLAPGTLLEHLSLKCKRAGNRWRYLCPCSASGCSARSCGVSVRVLGGTATDGSAARSRKNRPRTTAPPHLQWIQSKGCFHAALRVIRCSFTKTSRLHLPGRQNPSVPCVFSSPVEHLSFIQAAAKTMFRGVFLNKL